ncbi:hypothetical protein BDQ17DRAFT_1188348, partial [Cyathus striatus]
QPAECAVWTSAEQIVLCWLLVKEKDQGKQAGAGWKPASWTSVTEALGKEVSCVGPVKDAKRCTEHYRTLKKNFVDIDRIRNYSGMGWDSTLQICTTTDEVWEPIIKQFPHANYWCFHLFPIYNDMNFLVSGVVATGAGAFHSGQTPQSS